MRDLASRLTVTSAVVFAGHEPDVPAALAAIDVLALSSVYEGTPLALFEAMAAGKTIVSTDVDGWRRGSRGWPDGASRSSERLGPIRRALHRVLDDPGLARAWPRRRTPNRSSTTSRRAFAS